jgi:hypothetical protein
MREKPISKSGVPKERRVRFKVDKELDKGLIQYFLFEHIAGMDMGKNILRVHPELRHVKDLDKKRMKQEISNYVDGYYDRNSGPILEKMKEIEKAWYSVEEGFFLETIKLFGMRRSGMKCTAVMTILPFLPRWTHKKQFCVSFNYNIANNVFGTCHEILHFFFYDYFNRHFPKKLNSSRKWTFSEVFNDVVMNKKQFLRFYRPIRPKTYPEHRGYLPVFKALYHESKDIKDFIREGIVILKN